MSESSSDSECSAGKGKTTMTITSSYSRKEVVLEYDSEIADRVRAIRAASDPEDGIIQAWDMVPLFPGEPTMHTTTREYTALVAAGCRPVLDSNASLLD
jgi:hypothetical protein